MDDAAAAQGGANAARSGADGYSSDHGDLCDFLFADGSSRAIRKSIAQSTFNALTSRGANDLVAPY